MKNTILFFFFILAFNSSGQNGSIRGMITENTTKRGIGFISVTLKTSDGKVIQKVTANSEGIYSFDNVVPGSYSLKFKSKLHEKLEISTVRVLADQITFQKAELIKINTELEKTSTSQD